MRLGRRAVLLDVYRTVVDVDWAAAERSLAAAAGVEPAALSHALRGLLGDVGVGRLSMADALDSALRAIGAPRSRAEVAVLVRADGAAMCAAAVLFDDVVPFLIGLRERGVASAFVSNCAENTRAVLDHFGLTELVDAVVLSCDVGFAKPSAEIFDAALARLDLDPGAAVLIDDQAEYCQGATALGIRAIQLVRPEVTAVSPVRITDVATSLAEIAI